VSETWSSELRARGARIEGGAVQDFGDPKAELATTASDSVLADLSHLGIVEFRGGDASAFLQGQLTCDVDALTDDAAAYGAYCTPKGRVLANFLLWRELKGLRMLLSRTLVPAIRKRLQIYVLRSKVEIVDRSDDLVVLGASGPAAALAVADLVDRLPAGDLRLMRRGECTAIALPGAARFLIVLPAAVAPRTWDRLSQKLRPVGTPCWEWLEIVSGLPWITPGTQDEFVPQMANLELLGGVSFQKGCYPGQEIVARMQHLAKPKRRLFLAHVESAVMPLPGQLLYDAANGEQSAGIVVNAAPSPRGGVDLLAVVQVAHAGDASLRLGSPSGVRLQFGKLPYRVP